MAKRTLSKADWLPIEGEGPSEYNAFCIYKDLGPGRTVTLVDEVMQKMQPSSPAYNTLHEWKKRNRWDERILDYDTSLAVIQRDAEQKAVKETAEFLRNERLATIRINRGMADQLRFRAMEMLECGLYEKEEEEVVTGKDGNPTAIKRVYRPAKWSLDTIPKLIDVAMRLDKLTIFADSDQTNSVEVTQAATDQAQADLEAWRRKQAAEIAQIPAMPALPPGTFANPVEVTETQGPPDSE